MSDREDDDRYGGRDRPGAETAAQLSRLRDGLKRGLQKRGEARRQAAAAAAEVVSGRRRGAGSGRGVADSDQSSEDIYPARPRREDLGAQPYAEDFDETDPDAVALDDGWRGDAADEFGDAPAARGRRDRLEDDAIWRAAAAASPLTRRPTRGADPEPIVDDEMFDAPAADENVSYDWDDDWRDAPPSDQGLRPQASAPRRAASAVVAPRDARRDDRSRLAAAPDDDMLDDAAFDEPRFDKAPFDDADFDEAPFSDDPEYDAFADAAPRSAPVGRMGRARAPQQSEAFEGTAPGRAPRARRAQERRSDDDAPKREKPAEPRRPKRRPTAAGGRAVAAPSATAPTAAARRRGGAGAFSGFERSLSMRYLRARREEGFISVIAFLSLIGIALGVATLIIVMSVMNGFRTELIDRIVGVNGHLTVTEFNTLFDDYDEVATAIESVPGVVRAAPIIEEGVFAAGPRSRSGALVRGVAPEDLLTLERVALTPESAVGSLIEFGEVQGIAIGEGLARRLDVSLGDNLSLIYDRGAATPFGVAPRRRAYEVLYIFKTGMFQFDNGMIFMPLSEAQTFFNRQGVADGVEVMVATPDDLTGYREDIDAAVGRPMGYSSWQERNGAFIGALNTERSVMFLILSLLILIASLIIISGMIMLVKEKAPDIAILRTMGASRGAILRVFFMCGATIGVVGAAIGVALGVAISLNLQDIKAFVDGALGYDTFSEEVYLLSTLPSQLHWEDVGMTLAITLGLSFLATLYPAWRAAKLDPVEGLRNG